MLSYENNMLPAATNSLLIQAEAISSLARNYDPLNPDSHYALVTAAKTLSESLMTPAQHVLQQSINVMQVFAIRMMLKLGVLGALPRSSCRAYEGIAGRDKMQGQEKLAADGISLLELESRTGVHRSMIERFLRLLVGTRFIRQDEETKTYRHTHTSEAYLEAPGDYFASHYDECFISLIRYPEFIDEFPEFRIEEPNDPCRQVYSWRHDRLGATPWEVMESFPDRVARFHAGLSMVGPMSPVLGFFDFSSLAYEPSSDRVSLVDVGGGLGQCIVEILKAHPDLSASRMVLQDRPALIEASKRYSDLSPEVIRMAHDFFHEQPVKGARAYYLRTVLHDWPDALCTKILLQIARAMAPDSVLLIADSVLPDRVDEETVLAAAIDLYMFNIGGKERTVSGFDKILTPAGLRINKVYTKRGTAQGMVEAVLL